MMIYAWINNEEKEISTSIRKLINIEWNENIVSEHVQKYHNNHEHVIYEKLSCDI